MCKEFIESFNHKFFWGESCGCGYCACYESAKEEKFCRRGNKQNYKGCGIISPENEADSSTSTQQPNGAIALWEEVLDVYDGDAFMVAQWFIDNKNRIEAVVTQQHH